MILLATGCMRSEISVTPKNWKTTSADMTRRWKIHYRFYDPAFKDHPEYGKGKQVVIRGMNDRKVLADRQATTKQLIANEIDLLDKQLYNPILASTMDESPAPVELSQYSSLSTALHHALKTVSVQQNTRIDMRCVVKYFLLSAQRLNKAHVPVKTISRKDIRNILDNCSTLSVTTGPKNNRRRVPKIWTANQFNHYRKYLIILFNELEELEIVEFNPVEKIAKKEMVEKIKLVLSPEERVQVDQLLLRKDAAFHRFMNIFFHSGARLTELCKVQGKDVDLANQRFKVTIIKGKNRREVWKTIKDVALPYWIEAMSCCSPSEYIFAAGVRPGLAAIRPELFTRRWKKLVKSDGIAPDFYSLKHLNTTETVDQLGEVEAARQNSHTSTAMVVKIYDVKQAQRKHDKLKKAPGTFV